MSVVQNKKIQMARSYMQGGKVLIDLWYDDRTYDRVDYDVPYKIYLKQTTNSKILNGSGYKFIKSTYVDIDSDPLYEIEFKSLFDWNKAIRWFTNAKIPVIYATNYVWEYMVYHNLVCTDYLDSYVCLDIEVDPKGMDLKNMDYMQPIIAASLVGSDGREFVFVVKVNDDLTIDEEEEKDLINNIYSVCVNYRCILGWNVFDFDMNYIKERCVRLHLDLDWDLFPLFDLIKKYKEFLKRDKKPGEITNNKLDNAAMRMLGEGKLNIDIHKMVKHLRDEPEKVKEYVMQDSRLVNKLYQIKGIGSLCRIDVAISQKLHNFPTKTYPTHIFELYIDLKAREIGMKIPNAWTHYQKKVKKKGAGGLVLDPIKGLQSNVIALDFKSLYPNIIRTHNIGINNANWTAGKEDKFIVNTRGIDFKKNIKSINSIIMDELIETRYKYRDLLDNPAINEEDKKWYGTMSDAYKLLLVSANGVFDQENFKYRNQQIYEATTLTGQWYLRAAKKIAEDLGYIVYYGDTDSLYLGCLYGDDYKKMVRAIPFLEEQINDKLKEIAVKKFNLDPDNYTIDLRAEKIYSKIYFSEMKNYIGQMVWKEYKWLDPKDEKSVDVKGIVMKKYNTIPIVKEAMGEVFKILLSNLDDELQLKKQFVLYLSKLKADLYSGKRDDLLVISQKVDTLEGYKNEPPHIRAAKKLDAIGKFEPGMNVEYIKDATGEMILYGIEKTAVSKRTYDQVWREKVGKWVLKIAGRDIASARALDFGIARPAQTL